MKKIIVHFTDGTEAVYDTVIAHSWSTHPEALILQIDEAVFVGINAASIQSWTVGPRTLQLETL